MSEVEVTYVGNQQCVAVDKKNGKRLVSDCSMTKGEEFGPESLVAAGLGSCMLLSMSFFADRHELDISDARVAADVALGGTPTMRISTIDITARVPGSFSRQEQAGLEAAAESCPIKHSFGPDTKITTRYEFGSSRESSDAAP